VAFADEAATPSQEQAENAIPTEVREVERTYFIVRMARDLSTPSC
jgi:hypothetical protein